jgi:hypothetical protein
MIEQVTTVCLDAEEQRFLAWISASIKVENKPVLCPGCGQIAVLRRKGSGFVIECRSDHGSAAKPSVEAIE